MKAAWRDTIENNLMQDISALRKVLGKGFPLIETMPQGGCGFVAEVRERREEVPVLIVREHTRSSVVIEREEQ